MSNFNEILDIEEYKALDRVMTKMLQVTCIL